MKQHMMIIGAEIVRSGTPGKQDDIIKLTVISLNIVKQKMPGLMDMLGGNIEQVVQQVQQTQQIKDTIHITSKEWVENGYKLGKHITVEVLPDESTGGVK